MTEQNQMPPDDHELEQFLARRSDLSQRYRADAGADAAGEGAPPELDAAVLARARAELQRPAASSRRFLRWGRPLALAASLMLVVSLGWMAQQKPLPQEVAQNAAPAVVPKEVAVPAMDAIPAPVARQAEEAERKAPEKAAAPARSRQPGSAPAADALTQRQSAETRADIAPPPPPPPAAEPSLPKPVSVPAPAQPAAPIAMTKPAVPEGSRDQAYAYKRESRSALAASSAGAAESAPVPAAPAAATAAPAPAPFAPTPQMAAPVLAAPAANSAPAPNPCASSPVHGAALGQVQVTRGPNAAAWLQQIRHLRDASDLDGARAELACFSYLHAPGDVPEDLRSLLQPVP